MVPLLLRSLLSSPTKVKVQFPDKLAHIFDPWRYKIMYGGRGSSKSWSVARALLLLAAQFPLRILCAREVQKSITESVHRLLCEQAVAMGLENHFVPLQHSIKGRNGSEFLFAGLRSQDISKVKSFEGADICWVEEAQTVSKRSWDVLIPTIRKPGSEIWITFNPELEDDDTYQRFVVNPPSRALVIKINWSDNPWFPEELRDEMEHLKRVDPNSYAHVWEGECWSDKGGFFKAEWFRYFTETPSFLRIYMASDFAVTDGSGDYTEHGVFGIDPDDNIFVLDWWYGQTASDEWIESLLDLIERYKPVTWFGEAGVIRRSIEPFLTKRMRERKVYCVCEWLSSIHDKPTRARGIQARCSMGKVYFRQADEDAQRVSSQMLRFPAGKFDDAVDVMSLIGRALDGVQGGKAPGEQRPVSRIEDHLKKLRNRGSSQGMRG